jgi:hypothetical protein
VVLLGDINARIKVFPAATYDLCNLPSTLLLTLAVEDCCVGVQIIISQFSMELQQKKRHLRN